ncbi:MAG: Bug family tripartite tricarboxylate transporter substrate binding protein [Pigmentiphaga sp.]
MTIIVPFSPGGSTDVLARLYAEHLRRITGQNVIVDNRPGAGGTLGVQVVQRAKPDGLTLLFDNTAFIQGAIQKTAIEYDPIGDFEAVAQVALSPVVLGVPVTLGVSSVPELIAHVRQSKRPLSYGSAGYGQTTHFYGEMFRQAADLDLTYVPYKGEVPFLTALIADQVSLGFATVSAMRPHLESGRLVPLAVPGTARTNLLPEVPTLGELGFNGFEAVGWFGLLVPAGTPSQTVERLNEVANDMLVDEKVIATLQQLALPPAHGTPAQFAEVIRNDLALWTDIVAKSGIRMP